MASPLEERCEDFKAVAERLECEMPSPLIAIYRIPLDAFQQLRISAAIYLCRCMHINRVILNEEELLDLWVKNQEKVKNVTPNGMIVPKRHLILEYNQLVKAFVNIINDLNIYDLVSSWHIPLNLRYKSGTVNDSNLKRHHPTEHIHTDSWAGESAESVTTMIQIFGDVERNHVTFFHPPADFKEEWLGPRPTYLDGKGIADRYSRVEFLPSKGELIISDFASMHCSSLLPSAGARISIDTTFALKRLRREGGEVIHPWREGERASNETLMRLGEQQIFVFPDKEDQHVDSEGGFKHPTNLKLVPLLE